MRTPFTGLVDKQGRTGKVQAFIEAVPPKPTESAEKGKAKDAGPVTLKEFAYPSPNSPFTRAHGDKSECYILTTHNENIQIQVAVNEGTADCVDVFIDGIMRASKEVPKVGKGKISSTVIFNRAVYKGWAENKELRGKAKGKAVSTGPKRELQPKSCEMWVKNRDTSRDYNARGEYPSAAGTIVIKCYQKIEKIVADEEGSQTQSQNQTQGPSAEDVPAQDAPAQVAPAQNDPAQDPSAADTPTQDLQSAQVTQTPVAPTQAAANNDADAPGLFVEPAIHTFEDCPDWHEVPGNKAFPDVTRHPEAKRDFAIEFANGTEIRRYKENEKGRSLSQRVLDALERKPGEYKLYCIFVFHLRSLTTLKALGFTNLPEKWETRTPNGPTIQVPKPKVPKPKPGSKVVAPIAVKEKKDGKAEQPPVVLKQEPVSSERADSEDDDDDENENKNESLAMSKPSASGNAQNNHDDDDDMAFEEESPLSLEERRRQIMEELGQQAQTGRTTMTDVFRTMEATSGELEGRNGHTQTSALGLFVQPSSVPRVVPKTNLFSSGGSRAGLDDNQTTGESPNLSGTFSQDLRISDLDPGLDNQRRLIQASENVPNQLGTISKGDSELLFEAQSQQSDITEVAPLEDVEATARRSDPFYRGSKMSLIDRDIFVEPPSHTFPSLILGLSQSTSFNRDVRSQRSFDHGSQHGQQSLPSSQAPTASGSWPSLGNPSRGSYIAGNRSYDDSAVMGGVHQGSTHYDGILPFSRALFPFASKQDDNLQGATASKRKADGISDTITDHYSPSPKQMTATPLHRQIVNKAGFAAGGVHQRVRGSPVTPTPAEKTTQRVHRSSVTPTPNSTPSRLQRRTATPEIQQAESELVKARERLKKAAEKLERVKKDWDARQLKKIQRKTEKTNLAAAETEEEAERLQAQLEQLEAEEEEEEETQDAETQDVETQDVETQDEDMHYA